MPKKVKKKEIIVYSVIAVIVIALLLAINYYAQKPEFEAGSIDDPDSEKPAETRERFLEGTEDIGVLLVHGISATAWETHFLADYLNERNITTYQVLLGGHGNSIYELEKSKASEWYNGAKRDFDKLSQAKKFIVGVSLGGVVALELAEKEDADGIILISTPVWFKDPRLKYSNLLKIIKRYSHRELPLAHKPYYHENFPVRALAEMMSSISLMKKGINNVAEPALIIQSINDPKVVPESSQYIHDGISSKDKMLVWLSSNEHVPVVEYPDEADIVKEERQLVLEEVYNFIKANSK